MIVQSTQVVYPWRGDFVVFIGKDYWTQDKINEWLTKRLGYISGVRYVVANNDNNGGAVLAAFPIHAQQPGGACYLVAGPEGVILNQALLRDIPYITIEGYDYVDNYTDPSWVGNVPVHPVSSDYFNMFYGALAFEGVKLTKTLMLGRSESVNLFKVHLVNTPSMPVIQGNLGGVGYFVDCVVDCVNSCGAAISVNNCSVLLSSGCKLTNIQNVHGPIFWANEQSCISLATDFSIEGTPADDTQPWKLMDNTCLVKRGISIPGPVAGYTDASSSVMV